MSSFPGKLNTTLQIGTSRAGGSIIDDLPAPLRAQVANAAATPEAALWLSLGALDLWQRAGAEAGKADSAPPQASGEESLHPCPPAAESALSLLLQDLYPQLRAEWLTLLAARHCRLPLRYLPKVLDLGTQQRALRSLIVPVLGARGHWLARQNPDWDWVGTPATDHARLWEEGNLDQRVSALYALREQDAPAALQALRAVWSSEPPDSRAALLASLTNGLSLDDETFLEAALDDKRKEVRLAAQRMLSALPGSQLGQRMAARLAPLLRYERRLMASNRLLVELPAERDKAMLRDGVGTGVYHGLGEKAGWLVDMLAVVSPAYWTDAFGLPPADCIRAAAATDFQHALLLGWASALQRQLPVQGNATLYAWFSELAGLFIASDSARAQLPRDFFALFSAIPAPVAHQLLQALVDQGTGAWNQDQANLMVLLGEAAQASTQAWPASLAYAITARIRAGIASIVPPGWSLSYALPSFALVFDPAGADDYASGWPDTSPAWEQWREPIDKFLSTIQFRQQMHYHFQEHAA